MTIEPPLGQRESQTLEFKQAEVLDQPEEVGREVVAMLNAEGGEVWGGVREEEGRAVELQPFKDAERRAEALLDSLVDSIIPRVSKDEVKVEPVQGLVRVVVSPQRHRRPYALMRSSGWYFWRRIGVRTVPMTREEIFGTGGVPEDPIAATKARLLENRRRAAEQIGDGLWLRLEPVRRLDIDTQADLFHEIVSDRRVTENRPGGWHFARSYDPPNPVQGGIEWAHGDESSRVERHGAMTFQVAARQLHWKGEANEISPFALLEYPVSAVRIARRIYQGHLAPDDQVLADLAFFGAGEWMLRPGTPGHLFHGAASENPQTFRGGDDFLLIEPEVFTGREILEEPDFCGFRLVRQVYGAFGLRESDMPRDFDRATRRLVFPD